MTFTPTAEQEIAVKLFATGENLAIQAGAGAGKALRDDEPVLTPVGWQAIGTLRVGDRVIGSDGRDHAVTGVYPQGVRQLFEVETSDGIVITADADHLWTTQTSSDREHRTGRWAVRTTREIAETLLVRGGTRVNHYLPLLSAPVEGPAVDLPLDAWLIGALIGDGSLCGSVSFSNPDPLVLDEVRRTLPADCHLVAQDNIGKDWRIKSDSRVKAGHQGFWNPVTEALKDLGIWDLRSHEKVLPPATLRMAPAQRLRLLQGLMDTDGYADGTTVEWCTTSEKLAEQFAWLVHSLGGIVTIKRVETHYVTNGKRIAARPAWRVWPRLPIGMFPFAHSAKVARWTPRSKYPPRRQVVAVRLVAPDHATCITVDAPDALFAVRGCVLTHNTATLILLAQQAAENGRKGQYLAFNKSIVTDAATKFPGNVMCSTAHSLAYRAYGYRFKARLNSPRLKSMDIARILKIDGFTIHYGQQSKPMSAGYLAGLVMRTISNFCSSADLEPTADHVPYVDGIDVPVETPHGMKRGYDNNREVRRHITPAVQRAWADLNDPRGQLTYGHHVYLKAWQLSGPRIDADFLLVDEGQDLSGCMVAIIEAQTHAQTVIVGDSNQAIYGWLGLIDALGRVAEAGGNTTFLSQSFRFGHEIANVANGLLGRLDSELVLSGYGNVASVVGPIAEPVAILTRTNAESIRQMLTVLAVGRRPHLIGGGGDVAAFCRGAKDLMDRGWTAFPELACFQSWGEVQDYVVSDEQGGELKLMVDLIDAFGVDTILDALNRGTTEAQADLIISTAHKAKGREWDSVQLAGDFFPPKNEDEDVAPAELKLLYVAVTRAKRELDVTNVPHALGKPKTPTGPDELGPEPEILRPGVGERVEVGSDGSMRVVAA